MQLSALARSQDIKFVSVDLVRTFLKQRMSTRDRAIFTLMYWRGLRASEVGLLQMKDWDPNDKTGTLYVHREKNGVSGRYSLTKPELKALREWFSIRGDHEGPIFLSERGSPISRQRLHTLMRRYATAAGFPPDRRHCHVLRHSILTHLREAGVSIVDIQDWAGHRKVDSTLMYAAATQRTQVAETMEKWYGGGESAIASKIKGIRDGNKKQPTGANAGIRRARRGSPGDHGLPRNGG